MKYLSKKFSTPANSQAFVDNWESIFGKSEEPEREKPKKDDDEEAG